uniref:RRM domain-containing protein n=1 Tax=Parascaris univalens TaxID=6257 RepID=A0A915ANK0_PARUN
NNGIKLSGGDPARVQMTFERAVTVSAAEPNANLWLQYGSWLDSKLKIPSVAVSVYERAIRHAPCVALWQQYLSALERADSPAELIDSKWPLAKESICTADEGLSLYRTYIYLMRRRASEQGKDYAEVLKLFDEGSTLLQERFGQHWDSRKAQYRKNNALFLYTVAGQPEKGRKIWNDILASGSGHLAAAWLEAANLERFFGDVNIARKILYRAINSASDHPHMVYEALIQFEREVGTLKELDKALEKVNAQAARVAVRSPKKKAEHERSGRSKKEVDRREAEEKEERGASLAQKGENVEKESKSLQNGGKRQHDEANDHADHPEEKKAKVVIDEDGFAVPTSLRVPKKVGSGGGAAVASTEASSSSSSVNGSENSAKTVFISNLDFKLPKEKIMQIFPNAKEVRFIQRGMSKLHKGFGYVDFETVEEAQEALSKDRHLIDGRPMYVSENKPHEKGQRNEFRYPTTLEKNKLFVNNVHYDATSEQVKEVFAVFGAIRDVRIVTHKSGKSKGCAYVEFVEESSASAALKAEDIVLLERKLSVAYSNPPKKRDLSLIKLAPTSTGHQRSKIDLVPRALSRGKADAPKPEEVGMNPQAKLSNEQFRSFLSK